MFKDKETNEYMYPILGFDNYSISRGGRVGKSHKQKGNANKYQKYTTVETYFEKGKMKVNLINNDGEIIVLSVAKLNLNSIYGELPFKVGYYDGNPKNVIQDNLYYIFNNFKISEDFIVGDMKFNDKVLILSDKNNNCEIFKPIPDEYIYNNFRYWISSKGAIFDSYRNCLVSRSNDDHGYYKIALQIPGKMVNNVYVSGYRATLKVHSLVYAAWIDCDLRGMTIDHVDGRRYNNDVLNLEKVTIEENIRRSHDRNINEKLVIRSKWASDQVHLVCKMLEDKKLYVEIAEALGIDPSDKTSKDYKSVANLCIAIRDGRSFHDISKNYNIPGTDVTWNTDYKTPTKFNQNTIRKICEGLVDGKTPKELHELYPEIPAGTIYNIKIGRQYKTISSEVDGMDKIINSRTRYSELAKEKNLTVPEKFNKEIYLKWRREERQRLRAIGINKEANMQTTPWPEYLPDRYKKKIVM